LTAEEIRKRALAVLKFAISPDLMLERLGKLEDRHFLARDGFRRYKYVP
jgi:hypothetical protein